ncbi:MAG: hypothetical protein MUO76_20005 [Anaerolineaceae bacterium]|nr:hypothetical protein [Anaerolineaceae bacterium]
MAYSHTNTKGVTYVLHAKTRTLKDGRQSSLYYFARDERDEALDAVPEGYKVVETKTGMLILKRVDA